jgi:hypothetical protein
MANQTSNVENIVAALEHSKQQSESHFRFAIGSRDGLGSSLSWRGQIRDLVRMAKGYQPFPILYLARVCGHSCTALTKVLTLQMHIF